MSKTSTIYDAIKTRVQTILPDHKELVNIREIDENDELTLARGQGVSVGAAINSNRNLSCRLSVQRQYLITITRAVRGHDRDISAIETTTKNLLEDQFLVIQDIEKNPTINSQAARLAYLDDSGVEEVFAGAGHYLMIQTNFELEYIETLS